MKTKAAILTELGKPLTLAEIEMPELKQGQVLVRVMATGVCGSQLGEIDGAKGPDPWLPHLLGHEAGGIVEAVGPGVTTVTAGDHVVLHWRPGAGLEAEPASYRWNGHTVYAGRVTTFQERAIVSENRVTTIPRDVPFDLAALYGCGVTTAFGIIENDAKLKPGETVLVLGAGGLGLMEIAAAKICGAGLIIAVDRYPLKLNAAQELGAAHVIDASQSDAGEEVKKILNGRHLDIVLENTGLAEMIELGYELCGSKGRTILVGVPDVRKKARIDTLPLHFGKVLTGSHGGSAKPASDIPRLLRLQRERNLDLSRLISAPYALDEINQAISDLREGRVIRPMIYMK